MARQAGCQTRQRQPWQGQNQAFGAHCQHPALGADLQLQRARTQGLRRETVQAVAAGQRHIRFALQLFHHVLGQTCGAAIDTGQHLSHGLERTQPPDDPFDCIQVFRDHVVEGACIAQLDQRQMAQDALAGERIPEAHAPQWLPVQLRMAAHARVIGFGLGVDPGLVVRPLAHDEHDAALEQLQRIEAHFFVRQIVMRRIDFFALVAGKGGQSHAQVLTQLVETRLQGGFKTHRAVFGQKTIHVFGFDPPAPVVGRGFQHQHLLSGLGQTPCAIQT